MGSKIAFLAGGMILGMAVLVACDPLYKSMTDAKDDAMKKMKQATNKAEKSLDEIKQKVSLKTDDALDTINGKIDDLINVVEDIDVSKFKGKSKTALEAMKKKVLALKQN